MIKLHDQTSADQLTVLLDHDRHHDHLILSTEEN